MIALLASVVLAFAQQAASALPDRAAIEAALARDPATLPRAAAERWKDWSPKDPLPEPLRPRFELALGAYRDGEYGLTLELLHEVLQQEPDFPAALYQCGTTYFRLRRYGDCQRTMERFLAAVPREIGATQALGHCYYSLGDYERARDHYERVVAANADSVEAWRGLGLAHLRLGDAERALACLDRALKLRPQHADALVSRAQALLDLGRGADACAAAKQGVDLAPHDPKAWFVLAQALTETGRDEEAAQARQRFAEASRLEQEIRSQEGVLLHDPHSTAILLKLAALHLEAKNAAEAKDALVRALKSAPDDVETRVFALRAWVELGDDANAQRTVDELQARFASQPAAWEALEQFYRARGDTVHANEAAERARRTKGVK